MPTPWTRRRTPPRRMAGEALERRRLLSGLPWGASAEDTGEFLLGDVAVSVVLMESDGSIDADTEQWTPESIENVKQNVADGLQWWVDTLAEYTDKHTLEFTLDFTYADQPVATGYEPISRPSDDFELWIEDFFKQAGVASSADFSDDIRAFNHQQRLAHDTNWAFTIFVVNAEADANNRFELSGSFTRAFSYPGGRFIVMPHNRPASTIAHETGHMFWALDEYAGGESYAASRGYYNTLNANAYTGNPHPETRVESIMDSPSGAYEDHAISPAAREMIGWRDTDGDGVFDVLDVPLTLTGAGTFDESSRTYRFVGESSVQTLPNQNPQGAGNDITINRITAVQYRVDGGAWRQLADFDAYQVQLDFVTPPLPVAARLLEVRTLDGKSGVSSQIHEVALSNVESFQNPTDPLDVSGDGVVSSRDVLLVIMEINRLGAREAVANGPPYFDVSGDGLISARDALLVIAHLNTTSPVWVAAHASAQPQPAPSSAVVMDNDQQNQEPALYAVAFSDASRDPWKDAFWNDDEMDILVDSISATRI